MRHKLKRFLSLLLCTAALLCLLPLPDAHASTLSGSCGEKLSWTLDTEAKHLILSGSGEMKNYYYKVSHFDIDHIDDRPPWESYASEIRKVSLPEGLSSIGDYAFLGFRSLTEINLPSGITYIGDQAFSNCHALSELSLGEQVQHIGSYAFYNCRSLKKIEIPDSVSYLGYSAFSGCNSLEEALLGTGLESILSNTFGYCSALKSVTIPHSVTAIEYSAFLSCDSLCHVIYTGREAEWEAITLEDGNTALSEKLCASVESTCGSYRFCTNCGKMPYFHREHSFSDHTCLICGVPDALEYTVKADGSVSLLRYADPSLQFLSIPATVEGLPVTSLDAPFLRDCNGLLGITLPETIAEIRDGTLPDVPLHILFAGSETQWQSLGVAHLALTLHCNADVRQLYWLSAGDTPVLYCGICHKSLNSEEHLCDHSETELQAAAPPTCTEDGYSGDLCCLLCGELLEQGETLPATGHIDTVTTTVEPSCTLPGSVTVTCACGVIVSVESISPSGHSYESTVTPPTCTEEGYTTYTCLVCGDTYTDDQLPSAGHTDTTILNASLPTCTEDGYSGDLCCLLCGELLEQGEVLPATGHSYYAYICLYCGQRDPKAPIDNPFSDVFDRDYFYSPVLWAVSEGITTGTSPTTFSPNESCTRGQIVTFLWRAAGSPEPVSEETPFRDVNSDAYYYKAVLWAVEQGITTGTGPDTFSPDVSCTRAQCVTFLWRSQGMSLPAGSYNPFEDITEGDYYYYAVLWAVERSITTGTGAGKFSPNDSCTRGQIVTFLYRTMS